MTLLTDLAPYLLACVVGLAAWFGYGRAQRKAGEATAEARHDREVAQAQERMAEVQRQDGGAARDRLKRGRF